MRLVIEARHVVVGLRHQLAPGEPPAGIGLEERQPAAVHEVVDERGDEHGLAGAGKPGHAEPHGRRAACRSRPSTLSTAILASSVMVVRV